MLVNMKLDANGFKRITYSSCRFHCSSLYRIAQLKQSWQYWHSCFCREFVKNSSQCVHHLSFLCCHSLRVNIHEQILPSTFQVYFTEQCLIELKHKHHAKQSVLKLSLYFNAGMSYINPASFAIPWNIPFLSSNNVEGASNSAILP